MLFNLNKMISKRIRTIASLIDNESSVIDVGTDHGFLAVCLREKGNEKLFIGTDIRKGPIANAEKTMETYGIKNAELYQTSGVNGIQKQCDVAVIAGMGYHNVVRIITDAPEYFHNCREIIIQINTDVWKLRKWLMENHFAITDEEVIKDRKYYEILTVENGEMTINEDEIKYGPVLLRKRDEVFTEYYQYRLSRLREISDGIDSANPDRQVLADQISDIEKMLLQSLR